MRTDLYPIPGFPFGRLAIMPRPRSGDWLEDEIENWRRFGLDVVVSLLEDGEIAELGLRAEPQACRTVGLDFRRFPMPDRGLPPEPREFTDFISALVADLSAGRSVGVHCRIGVGRAALVAASVLSRMGLTPDQAWSAVEKARGRPVPDTPEQRAWVGAWVSRAASKQPTVESQP
jgi:protein-tyrosine phosphatase